MRPARAISKKTEPRTFAPGARVVIRDEEWIVRSAQPTSTGGTAVYVTGLSELVRGKDAIFLTELDEIEELAPEDTRLVPDPSPRYRRSRLYLESLLRQTPPTDARLYVGHCAAIDPADYQLVPAVKALAQPRPRILIADAVGLGKTIEVGILLSELIRRGQGRRILVVALKSVLEQFQQEMWARFTIPLVRLDSIGLERVQRQIPANMNPFYYFDRVIISIDTLKKDQKYRRYLEACHWDAIVIDECQHVAVRARAGSTQRSQRAQLAQLLARTCDALIMTSATPHDGRPESFASLMNLLEPTAVADPSNYTADDVQGLYVRRFKKDIVAEVGGQFRERKLRPAHIPASAAENAVFRLLATARFRTIGKRGGGDGLFRALLIKAFLSSPQALIATIDERGRRLERSAAQVPDSDDHRHDQALLHELRTLAARISPADHSKLPVLVELLRDIGVTDRKDPGRVVIFSERIPTLEMLRGYLAEALGLDVEGAHPQIDIFHGTLDDQKQMALRKEFSSQSSRLRVLLGSDAAAEGINLHYYCHHLIHFDIPWSLITLEQRNGRIDRYGQTQDPAIHYLLTVPDHDELRGDLRVLDRLIEKENAAHQNLGDACWLLGLHDAQAEEEHVARGIIEHQPAEEIIPEQPEEDDFLATLMAAAEEEERTAGERPQTASLPSLYGTDLDRDLAFVRDAFAELAEDRGDGQVPIPPPEWHEHIDGLTLEAPDDLKRRFTYLPPELRPHGDGGPWRFKLTANRDLVKQALADARQDSSRWPEWQLLWEQHPILGWLGDRVAAHLSRGHAPVLRVPTGLAPEQAAFVFQGIVSNQRSQPVIVSWFGVVFAAVGHDEPTLAEIIELPELIARTGLAGTLSNDGQVVDTTLLEPMRKPAVQQAKAHMQALRKQRARELRPLLVEDEKRVKAWQRRALAQLDHKREAAARAGRSLRADERTRLDRAQHEIEQRVAARSRWFKQTVTTSELPYVRLTAVLVPADGIVGPASEPPNGRTSAARGRRTRKEGR